MVREAASVLSARSLKLASETVCWPHAVITSLNLLVICYILVAGLPRAHPSYLADFAPYGLRGIFHGSSLVGDCQLLPGALPLLPGLPDN